MRADAYGHGLELIAPVARDLGFELVAAGPVSDTVGVGHVLGFAAVWQVATVFLTLAVPSVRGVRAPDRTAAPMSALQPQE